MKEIMKPLFHPALDAITLEGIFHALSDPVRAAIFAEITLADCPQTCTVFSRITERTIPKSTLSQHFKTLREAGLIRSGREGVEMHNVSRCQEIEQRFPGLMISILTAYKKQMQEQAAAAAQ